MLATIGLGLTKASILVFFRNIFSIRYFKIWADIMLIVVTAWTVAFFFSNLFTCYPITALVEPYYGNNCIAQLSMWYASCITDFVVDFVILAMPIPLVLKLQVHWHQKLALQLIFLLGTSSVSLPARCIVTCAYMGQCLCHQCHSIRYVLACWKWVSGALERFNLYVSVAELIGSLLIAADYTSPVFFWTNIEISLGVITACTPTYRPLWLSWKGGHTVSMRVPKQRLFSVFDFLHFRSFRLHRGTRISEEDNAQLNQDASVNTFIETGNPDSMDHMDIGSISVKHDIHTNSSMQPFDRIV